MNTATRLRLDVAIAQLPCFVLSDGIPDEVAEIVIEVLEEFYTDGITRLVSAQLDDQGNIVGEFTDRVGLRSFKRFTYLISNTEVIYRPINAEEIEGFSDLSENYEQFAPTKKKKKKRKKPKCKRGFRCGNSCQAIKNKNGTVRNCTKKMTKAAQAKIAKAKAELAAAGVAIAEASPLQSEAAPQPPGGAGSSGVGEFPDSLEGLEVVENLGGSTGAKLVRDPKTGAQYVLKKGKNASHIRSEHEANQVYAAAGVNVPKTRLYDTGGEPQMLAEFVEGQPLNKLKGKAYQEAVAELQKGFAVDALLGNWDVIGLSEDNIIVSASGVVTRVDNGGALDYRAQGAQKTGTQWNQYPTELWSMRNEANNPQSSAVFGTLSQEKINGQIAEISSRRSQILAAAGTGNSVMLAYRIDEMETTARVSNTLMADNFKDGYAGEFTRHGMQIREAGVLDPMSAKLSPKAGQEYILLDEDGIPFDSIRGDGVTQNIFAYVEANGGDWDNVGAWMSDQGDSSFSSGALMYKQHLLSQRTDSQDYFMNHKAELAATMYKEMADEEYFNSMTAFHAFNHEMLQNLALPNKNSDGTFTLKRTVPPQALKEVSSRKKLKKGETGVLKHSVYDSNSLVTSVGVYGTELIETKVPIHRIVGTYLNSAFGFQFDQATGLAGDAENEMVAMLSGLPSTYRGKAD